MGWQPDGGTGRQASGQVDWLSTRQPRRDTSVVLTEHTKIEKWLKISYQWCVDNKINGWQLDDIHQNKYEPEQLWNQQTNVCNKVMVKFSTIWRQHKYNPPSGQSDRFFDACRWTSLWKISFLRRAFCRYMLSIFGDLELLNIADKRNHTNWDGNRDASKICAQTSNGKLTHSTKFSGLTVCRTKLGKGPLSDRLGVRSLRTRPQKVTIKMVGFWLLKQPSRSSTLGRGHSNGNTCLYQRQQTAKQRLQTTAKTTLESEEQASENSTWARF